MLLFAFYINLVKWLTKNTYWELINFIILKQIESTAHHTSLKHSSIELLLYGTFNWVECLPEFIPVYKVRLHNVLSNLVVSYCHLIISQIREHVVILCVNYIVHGAITSNLEINWIVVWIWFFTGNTVTKLPKWDKMFTILPLAVSIGTNIFLS